MSPTKDKIRLIRETAENDLFAFIRLTTPSAVLGSVHEELITWITSPDRKSHRLVLLPRDHQKALSLTSKVLTPDGWTTVGALEVGSKIIGYDGKPQHVTHLHPISNMDLYTVTTLSGCKVHCNADHLWSVYCPSNTGKKLVTKSLREIYSNYQGIRFDKRHNKEFIECRYFLPMVAPVEFEEKQLPIDPYTLGVWLGDGHSAGGTITSADPEILEYLPFVATKHRSKYNYGLLGLGPLLRANNLLKNKHIPAMYMTASIEQRQALLQGLLDTDGSVNKTGKWIYFSQCAKREALLDQVVDLVRSLGGRATKYAVNTTCNDKIFPSFTIGIKLPKGIRPFRLSRKKERYQEPSDILKDAIVDIQYHGQELGRCITVSNEDGLFITDDYMVTHNSRVAAFWAAWQLTKNPHYRILYISSTANLAEKQLKFIKDLLTSKAYRTFWPEMVNERETDREKWTNNEISIDHPRRAEENVRDPSIFTAGLTSSITGLHCDIAVLDDVVVFENANTEDGREKVKAQVSLLTSIEGTDSQQLVVGTRYHPADVYNHMMDMEYPIYDKDGEEIDVVKVYDVFERKVEENGEFLWPRQQRPDGRWFGFDQNILSRKKAQYLDKTQFYAQYYNNPNNPEAAINRSKFQYYDKKLLERINNTWWYNDERINIFAAVDFAFSLAKKADFTAIVVIGIDRNHSIFVLDVVRFKTQQIKGYFDEILKAYQKWGFRKIRCEINSAQSVIVKDLKDNYIRPNGLLLAIDEHNPSRHEGSKEERVRALLEARYDNLQMWHYKGGNCEILEDELLLERPTHDDCKDALAAAVDICVAPKISGSNDFHSPNHTASRSLVHSRFGGMRF